MTLIRRFAAVFGALILAMAAPACARTQNEIHPALFVARDHDSTLYLFGTVHVRRPGTPWGGANAQRALAEADEVWTELEISPQADAEAAALVARLGLTTDDPLTNHLTPEENQRLQAIARRYNVDVNYFYSMRPWLAGITLTLLPLRQAGYDADAGVDRGVDESADAQGKTRRAFETIEQQIGFLANLSPELQHEMLIEALDEVEQASTELDGLTEAWERGDLDALEHFVIDDTREEYPEMYQSLFVARNQAWIEVLMHELEGSGVDFVAVGAGHLLGPDGLVEQLRARGVRVERVH